MAISVFLSTVSDEFRAYRDQLVHDLTRQNVAVKVQEDFKDLGGDTLAKLDAYIADCDAVVHLVGDMCGSSADETQQRALVAKHSDLQSKLPQLGEALKNNTSIPYTQWESWLALYHDKSLLIAKAKATAPRGPKYAPNDVSRAAQIEHLDRLKAFHRYSGSEFGSPDELAKQIAYTAILDLLAEDKARKARALAHDRKLDEILRKLSEDKSVPLDSLRAILDSMGETAASYDAAEIEQKLVAMASEFRDLTNRLNRLSNADPIVSRLRGEASAALTRGLFEEVDQLLADAEARDLSGLEDIEALVRQKRLSAADSRAQRGAAAMLRINPDAYRQAAAHYGEASDIVSAADALKAREHLRSQAGALVRLGDEFGDNAALREAIVLLEAMQTAGDRGKSPLDWAATLVNLGNALAKLGEREGDTTRLEEAVKTYRAALEERTRERAPLDWAQTQNNLGLALWRLGERQSQTTRLEEAVAAYHAALKERTREQVPLEWAVTQDNLGLALKTLGDRDANMSLLEQAVCAHRAALEVRTRERIPLQWARTQTNLGIALRALGERESGVARLEEAITAYRAALTELTRDRAPLDWAATQNNLGNALSKLGERERGTAGFEEAVEAYRAALKERSRERAPLDWAGTQANLGSALRALGERIGDRASLEEAVEAYRAALEERTRERAPLEWAMTQSNLGIALATLGAQESGTARLEQGVKAFRAALEEWTRERVPLQWAGAQNNLGLVLWRLGERESGTERLEEAIAAHSAALEERTRERVPLEWAASLGNQGVAMIEIADRTNNGTMAESSFQQIHCALETLRHGGQQQWAAFFEAQLTKAQAIRDRLKGR
jgi:tetratricopeptide (TPR) repeat protein